MDPLEPPALHHVKAAFGWIELGNVPEALAELARIPVELQSLPTVRAARLDCLIAAQQWDDAVAAQQTVAVPAEDPRLFAATPLAAAGWPRPADARPAGIADLCAAAAEAPRSSFRIRVDMCGENHGKNSILLITAAAIDFWDVPFSAKRVLTR